MNFVISSILITLAFSLTSLFIGEKASAESPSQLCGRIDGSITSTNSEIEYASEQATRATDQEMREFWTGIVTQKRIELEILNARFTDYGCNDL